MNSIPIHGHIDDQHRLSAVVPESIPSGPVTVWIAGQTQEDDAGQTWMAGIGREWADDLRDVGQDIYTLNDGENVDPT